MRPMRLLAGWLIGAVTYVVAATVLFLAVFLLATSLLERPGTSAGSIEGVPGMLGAVTVVLVLSGSLAAVAACSVYRWHTGMSWWKWALVGLGGPALLCLVVAATASAAALLDVPGDQGLLPEVSLTFVGLVFALVAVVPAITAVVAGRMRNRRATALQEAVWPAAGFRGAPSRQALPATGAIPRVTRAGRDHVAAVAATVIGLSIVGAAALTALVR